MAIRRKPTSAALERLPTVIHGTAEACGDIQIIEAAATGDGEKKLKRISGVA